MKGYLALHELCARDGTFPPDVLAKDEASAVLLLRAGTPPMATTPSGLTPLHVAAGAKHITLARLLLAQGVDVNAQSVDGITPLHMAASVNCGAAIRLLIVHGAE